jgi:PTS system mannose-specific IIB component/fructoselysine and glucoselysine-specific PTS system IIB component
LSIELFRVDERLIHGQVVIGWGHQVRPDRYVVVDDELASSEWEQDLYRLGAGTADILFVDTAGAVSRIAEWCDDEPRTILLTRDVTTMCRLGDSGALRDQSVNLGGIHHGPGRREVLTYLHLTEAEMDDLRALEAGGAKVTARDLPDAREAPLSQLVGR